MKYKHWVIEPSIIGTEFSIRWHDSLPPDHFVHFLLHRNNFGWCFIYMSVSDDTDPSRHQHSISEGATLSHHQQRRTNNDAMDAKLYRKCVGKDVRAVNKQLGRTAYTLRWLRQKILQGTEWTREKGSLHTVTGQRRKKNKTSGFREVDVGRGSKQRQREKPRFQRRKERCREGQQCQLCGLEGRLSLSVLRCPFSMFHGTPCPRITFPFLVQEKNNLLHSVYSAASPLP